MRKSKKQSRLQRAKRARGKQRSLQALRLVVNRTPKHIYAQIIQCGDLINTAETDTVLVSASTVSKEYKEAKHAQSGNKDAASVIGKLIADKAKEAGISKVSFDRSGYMYHGRVKALADAARENGLEI